VVEGLKDIALPPPVPLLPPAPGWYALAGLLVLALAYAAVAYRRRRAANLYRRQALRELDAIVAALDKRGGRFELAARLPELLKRVALHREPRAKVASLTGAAWLQELDRLYGGEEFAKGAGRLLPRLAYGSAAMVSKVPRAEIDALVRLCRLWIERHDVAAPRRAA
jgi:Ca-activated chloride channel family protein